MFYPYFFEQAHYIETEISTFSTTSNNMADIIMDLISNQDEEPPEVSDFRECLSHDVEMCMRMLVSVCKAKIYQS